ncbi:hypothetical protein H8959_016021 [Pygathrix nigripes]
MSEGHLERRPGKKQPQGLVGARRLRNHQKKRELQEVSGAAGFNPVLSLCSVEFTPLGTWGPSCDFLGGQIAADSGGGAAHMNRDRAGRAGTPTSMSGVSTGQEHRLRRRTEPGGSRGSPGPELLNRLQEAGETLGARPAPHGGPSRSQHGGGGQASGTDAHPVPDDGDPRAGASQSTGQDTLEAD